MGFSLTRTFPYTEQIVDSVPIRKSASQRKNPYSGIFYVKISKLDQGKYGSKTVNITEFR